MSTPARRAIYGKLAGDSTLTNLLATAAAGYSKAIYHNQAPENAQPPFVIFSKSTGTPTDTFGKPGAMETNVWMVKAVDQSTTADIAESIDARLRALLSDAKLSISGANHLYLRRVSDIEYPEVTDGRVFVHVGANYRLVYEPA